MNLSYTLTTVLDIDSSENPEYVCILPKEVLDKLMEARKLIKESENILRNTRPFSLNKN